MTSLADLIGAGEEIDLGGKKIVVPQIGIDEIGMVLIRFPELAQVLDRRAGRAKGEDPAMVILRNAKGAAYALMALAIGKGGDEAEEANAANIPLEYQLRLLAALIKVSFPGGLLPFVEYLTQVLT